MPSTMARLHHNADVRCVKRYNARQHRQKRLMNNCVKKDKEGDEYASISSNKTKSRASAKGGYLSTKAIHLHLSKEIESNPDVLNGNCFETTGFVVTRDACIQVSDMLIDSGAASSFISHELARKAGMAIRRSEARHFSTGGQVVCHDRVATFKLYLEGVKQKITAYIDEGPSACDNHILLGVPAMKQFDMRSNHCYGGKQETRWSISRNVKGSRRKRYVLRGDADEGKSVMQVHSRRRGLRLARRRGETSKERRAREVMERRQVKLRESQVRYVRAKHGRIPSTRVLRSMFQEVAW